MERNDQGAGLTDWRALVRTYPLPAIAVAAGIGVLISRALQPSRAAKGGAGGGTTRATIESAAGAFVARAAVRFLREKLTEVEQRTMGALQGQGHQASWGGR